MDYYHQDHRFIGADPIVIQLPAKEEHIRLAELPSRSIELSRDDIRTDLVFPKDTFRIWRGSLNEWHEFYNFGEEMFQGEAVALTPTVTSFYGHQLVIPFGITVTPHGAPGPRVRTVNLTIERADRDNTNALCVLAWQGDNDTFHLLAPLPGEDPQQGIDAERIFGSQPERSELRDWMLGKVHYGPSALLDVDVSSFITPGAALRA